MHHPGCWVKHGGCATQREHESSAVALAYGAGLASPAETPHPGEGTRVRIPPLAPLPPADDDEDAGGDPVREPVPLAPRAARERRAPAPPEPPDHLVPPPPPRMIIDDALERRQRAPYNPEPAPPAGERRRPGRGAPAGHHPQKPLPSVYRHHRILRYWYIPVAAGLALAVAFGFIWMVDQIAGGDGEGELDPAAGVTPGTTPGGSATTPTPPPGSPTPGTAVAASPSPTLPGGTSQKFKPGDVAVVVGTGDCLNVRVGAGLSNDAIICLADGEQVTVTGGPEGKDGLQWWKVRTESGEGWAAEDYLAKKP